MSGKFSEAIWKENNRLVEDVALTKWIDKEGQQIYCPKKNYNHALKNNLSPTKEWHKFPLIKYSFSCCEEYNFSTSDETYVEENIKKKNNKSFCSSLPEPPQPIMNKTNVKSVIRNLDLLSDSEIEEDIFSSRFIDEHNKTKQSSQSQSSQCSSFIEERSRIGLEPSPKKNVSSLPLLPLSYSTDEVLADLKKMQNVILKELAEIKVLLKEVVEIKFQATGVKLLELVDEVVTLDNKLKDKTEYTKLLDSLKKVGGRNPREHVFLIMKRLFSNQLQSKLNRKGNGVKKSLENLVNIWSVLRDSCEYNGGSVKDLEKSVTDVLRNAPARARKRKACNTDIDDVEQDANGNAKL
ncbi:uncharacterized protein LOC100204495 isoform X3 [Hydra vulgaris]|uniref:Uncharacterized protein LOC100204495 isoform X3 n=1 Tax=Hydra vulgaris TaxID=6087 RepID=A0ABM4CXJ1_HYDVU